MKSYT